MNDIKTKLLVGLLAIPGLLVVAVGLSAFYAWPVQLLYNYLVISTNPLGEFMTITFKQAWALSLLCNLLFKSSK